NVFATGQLGMKSSSDFEQTGQAATDVDPSGGRFRDAAENLQQGGFSGAIPTYDADDLTRLNLKGNISKRPELGRRMRFGRRASEWAGDFSNQRITKRVVFRAAVLPRADLEAL